MDNSYRFENDENVITLLYEHEGDGMERPYYISKSILGDVREEKTSECVMQLLDKKWVNKSMLYDLASIIEKNCPDNKIDWYTTFSIVESSFLHDFENSQLEDTGSEPLDFFDEIKLNRERVESSEFQHEIERRVIEGIERYNLKKK